MDARRIEYETAGLDVGDVDADPFVQVQRWWDEWSALAPTEPNAVVLATADEMGGASARTVLLRGLDASGFTFFTSYDSRKGHDLDVHPYGSILASWVPLLRQINVRGAIAKVDRRESEEYFAGRPRGSQLAAWASHQSSELANRAELEQRFSEAEQRFVGQDVPCPAYWGGYRLVPASIELWQGRSNRMHDRLRYERDDRAGGWRIVRLSP